ncbi:MAG: hypothetical protein ACRD6R_01485 [Candidatus Polarisedimenticolia bacterium]
MDAVFAAYERGTELNEGLAAYVEMRVAGGRSVDRPPTEFGPAEVRRRAYATGPTLVGEKIMEMFILDDEVSERCPGGPPFRVDQMLSRSGRFHIPALALGLLLCGQLRCFPYYARVQIEVPHAPLIVADVRSNEPIGAVLVIPRYSRSSGISSGAGHGPGAMTDTSFLAHAFVSLRGQPFAPAQPKSGGIVWGWFWGFTGTGTSIDGVLPVAPGFESRWFSDLWSRYDGQVLSMNPRPDDAALAELRDIRRLLDLRILNGPSKERFDLGGDEPLYVRFSEAEVAAAREYIEQGLHRLERVEETDTSGALGRCNCVQPPGVSDD